MFASIPHFSLEWAELHFDTFQKNAVVAFSLNCGVEVWKQNATKTCEHGYEHVLVQSSRWFVENFLAK